MSRKVNMRTANFIKFAEYESKMWRAYYNHRFEKLIFYLVLAVKVGYKSNWIVAMRMSWFSGRAAVNYRLKKGQEDYPRVLNLLERFYKIASDHALEPFDYRKAAGLELEWWDIHRYPKKYQKTLERSIAEAAAVIYHCQPERLMEYARYRAQAAEMLTHEGDKHPEKNDWPKIDDLLYKTWLSLGRAVRSADLTNNK